MYKNWSTRNYTCFLQKAQLFYHPCNSCGMGHHQTWGKIFLRWHPTLWDFKSEICFLHWRFRHSRSPLGDVPAVYYFEGLASAWSIPCDLTHEYLCLFKEVIHTINLPKYISQTSSQQQWGGRDWAITWHSGSTKLGELSSFLLPPVFSCSMYQEFACSVFGDNTLLWGTSTASCALPTPALPDQGNKGTSSLWGKPVHLQMADKEMSGHCPE